MINICSIEHILYKNKNKIMKKNTNKKNLTIDLKWIMAKEYLNSKKSNFTLIIEKYINIISIAWFIMICFLWLGVLMPNTTNSYYTEQNMSIQDKIRLERLEVCQEAYKNSWINKQFIYWQIPAVRCAAYLTLIYAYESWFWKSQKCIEKQNCWWIKWNWTDTPRWFLKFNTYEDWRKYFAKKYFQWHYKKNIKNFVYSRSMTDRETYINFMKQKYWKIYWELEYLYLTNR